MHAYDLKARGVVYTCSLWITEPFLNYEISHALVIGQWPCFLLTGTKTAESGSWGISRPIITCLWYKWPKLWIQRAIKTAKNSSVSKIKTMANVNIIVPILWYFVILFTLVLDNTGENWEIKMLSACTAIVSLSLSKYLFSAELKALCHEINWYFLYMRWWFLQFFVS